MTANTPAADAMALLPCPFVCGGAQKVVLYGGVCGGESLSFVLCSCGAEGPHCYTEEGAMQSWNRRPVVSPALSPSASPAPGDTPSAEPPLTPEQCEAITVACDRLLFSYLESAIDEAVTGGSGSRVWISQTVATRLLMLLRQLARGRG